MQRGEIRFIGKVIKVDGEKSSILIYPNYCEGLHRLQEYNHLNILYWFHLRDDENHRKTLIVVRRRHGETAERGVFASRSPSRPNPIGLTVVELISVDDCTLIVKGLDAFVDSPVIDIKPHRDEGK
jgi:formylmethanofuran dehydrogenase subunit E